MPIVEILKLGLSGLVFLFAFLGFRLLNEEQKKQAPNQSILRNIRFFNIFTLVAALLVGVFALLPVFFKHASGAPACHDSFSRLETISKLPVVTADDLRHAVQDHMTICSSLVGDLDR